MDLLRCLLVNYDSDVLIVGAGMAGLRCALELEKQGLKYWVLEAGDRVGGRIRSDKEEGFLMDRGFQVLLTAYDECQAVLDYQALNLGTFEPGALVWRGSGFSKLIDPWRRPLQSIKAALSPIGTLKDKWKVACLRRRVGKRSLEALYRQKEQSTRDYLKADHY